LPTFKGFLNLQNLHEIFFIDVALKVLLKVVEFSYLIIADSTLTDYSDGCDVIATALKVIKSLIVSVKLN